MRRKLKRSEYPKKLECLAQNCLSCPCLKSNVKYSDCPNFEWKQENMSKYDFEINDGILTNVYLKEE